MSMIIADSVMCGTIDSISSSVIVIMIMFMVVVIVISFIIIIISSSSSSSSGSLTISIISMIIIIIIISSSRTMIRDCMCFLPLRICYLKQQAPSRAQAPRAKSRPAKLLP